MADRADAENKRREEEDDLQDDDNEDEADELMRFIREEQERELQRRQLEQLEQERLQGRALRYGGAPGGGREDAAARDDRDEYGDGDDEEEYYGEEDEGDEVDDDGDLQQYQGQAIHPGVGVRLVGLPLDSRDEQEQLGAHFNLMDEQRRRDDRGGSNVRAGSMDGEDALGDDGLLMDQYYGEGSHLEMDEQEMDLQVRRSQMQSNRSEQTDGMQERRDAAWFGGQVAQQEEDGQHRYSEQTLPSRSSGEQPAFANAGARGPMKSHEDVQGSSSPDRSEDGHDGNPARHSGG